MTDQIFLQHFIFYGKVAGAVVAFGTLAAVFYRTLVSPVVRKVVHINETVSTLAGNCIPTIQRSLDAQDKVLEEVKKDVQQSKETITQYGEGLEETKQTVGLLHSALLTHLENSSAEKAKKKRHARSV